MSAVLLDTNVLLRFVERSAPEHVAVATALQKYAARGTALVLAPQVLVEFWVVATRPLEVNGFGWEPPIVAAALDRLRQRFRVLAESPDLIDRWLSLVRDTGVRGKSAHDARLAAIATLYAVPEILTLNVSHFTRFGAVTAIHPATVT